ncbi:hypothetical protein U1Q18_051862, partial [Sarracenia purpurea var. burkii]
MRTIPDYEYLEETSINETSKNDATAVLSNSDLFSFMITDDSSSSKSGNDVFFMLNSRSSSFLSVSDSLFM